MITAQHFSQFQKRLNFWKISKQKSNFPKFGKLAHFAIFVQKVLISETVTDRAKRTKIWDHMHHNNKTCNNNFFWMIMSDSRYM